MLTTNKYYVKYIKNGKEFSEEYGTFARAEEVAKWYSNHSVNTKVDIVVISTTEVK